VSIDETAAGVQRLKIILTKAAGGAHGQEYERAPRDHVENFINQQIHSWPVTVLRKNVIICDRSYWNLQPMMGVSPAPRSPVQRQSDAKIDGRTSTSRLAWVAPTK
jgi:hypothetical protein